MRVRFTVRPDEDDPGRFAVWDGAVHGWRARGLPNEPAATRAAAELELQYDAHGPRSPDSVRKYGDEQPAVEMMTWSPAGSIHAWLRTDGEWYGLVCDEDGDGHMSFIPGSVLRLTPPQPADPES